MSNPRPTPQSERLAALPSLPRDDDGPVFAEPWQAQAFALAVKLSAQGHFSWKEWTEALTHHLSAAAARGEPDVDGSHYYDHWLAALEQMVIAKGLANRNSLAARRDAWEDAYQHTPHGHPVELGSPAARRLVIRADGRAVELLQRRAHLRIASAAAVAAAPIAATLRFRPIRSLRSGCAASFARLSI